jgi:hypothetical protein
LPVIEQRKFTDGIVHVPDRFSVRTCLIPGLPRSVWR